MHVQYLPHGGAIIPPLPQLMVAAISRSATLSPTHLSVGSSGTETPLGTSALWVGAHRFSYLFGHLN